MMSSSEAFDVGLMEGKNDGVFVDSILRKDILGDDSLELINDANLTPTRSERKVKIDAPWSLSADKDDPVHSSAKDRKW